MDPRDIERIAKHCDQILDLDNAKLSDEYFYQSLPLCVIDAVYSIGVNYESVRNIVNRYCDYFKLQKIRRNRSKIPPRETQESITDFCKKKRSLGIDKFTNKIFDNRQRTSSINGILKSEAVFKFAGVLKKYNTNYLQDVPKISRNTNFEREIRLIPGQGSGISLRAFFMSYDDNLIKPDRMILRFLGTILQREVDQEEAHSLLVEVNKTLKSKYLHLTPRLLDHEIWKYQKER